MKIIDLHTDTLTRYEPHKAEIFVRDPSRMLDYPRMKEGGYLAVALAVFLELGHYQGQMFLRAKSYFDTLDELMEDHRSEVKLYDGEDDGRIQIIRTIEEGEEIEGDLEKLEYFKSRALKMMTLTWNYPNSLAFPNHTRENRPELTSGLTSVGREVVRYLDKNHIILDVSHLGDKAFYELPALYHGPLVASHSNAREVTDVVRNLSDEMIRTIAASGGVIGLNLCESFAKVKGVPYLDGLALHLEHLRAVGGVGVLALGSDFDGIDPVLDLCSCDSWNNLFKVLVSRGWSRGELEALAYKNARRALSWTL